MLLAYQKKRLFLLLLCLPYWGACNRPNSLSVENPKAEAALPAWLRAKIANFQAEAPTNPPVKIYRYNYQGQAVYYISSYCCDIPSEVYTVEGQQLCQPDGGFTGRGDGKCLNFFETRTNEELIWEDLRK